MNKPSIHDLMPGETNRGAIRQHRPAPQEVAARYDDAQLYRIVVALSLYEGRFNNKAEFDAHVRTIGNIEAADELIAFRKLRPGCKVWRSGKYMICECGSNWLVGEQNPPHCKETS